MLSFPPGIDLFEWQAECLDLWLKNSRRGIVNVVTGAGKTFLALAAIYNSDNRDGYDNAGNSCNPDGAEGELRVKIVVPKVFLAKQWLNTIKDNLHISREEIGLYYGVTKEDIRRKYMIYVLNSARYCLSRHILSDFEKGHRVLLICDECHHMGSTENRKIFDFLSVAGKFDHKYFSLGLSATPETNTYQDILIPALGKEIYRYNFIKAAQAKVIAQYNVFNVALDFMPDELQEYAEYSAALTKILSSLKSKIPSLFNYKGAQFYLKLQKLAQTYEESEISSLAQYALGIFSKRKEIVYCALSRLECTAELISRLSNDNKIIVFGERIEKADALYKKLKRMFGSKVGRYHSEMGDGAKKNALSSFGSSETTILVCCKALDEGLNVPDTDVGIIMSSTGSVRQRIQRLGRVLRRDGDQKVKSIYYLHIPDSTDENEILPEELHNSLAQTQLYYDYQENEFHNPYYDELRTKLEKKLSFEHYSQTMIDEVNRNLRLGAVRLDYLLSGEQYTENVLNAVDLKTRNYWITMNRLHEIDRIVGEQAR